MTANPVASAMRAEPVRRTYVVDNGLRLVVECDHTTPAVAVNLWYGVGSRHEQVGRTGLAHLFEHLMFQGSANVAAGEHFAALDKVGASTNATTFFDRTNYFETVPTGALDLALWLEADRMGGLLDAVDQRGLDAQREVVRNERRERVDNQPYGTSDELLFAALFPLGHQYHHLPIGSMEDLQAASLDDVRAFFIRHYAPANAVLSIVGDIEPEDALERVQRYFGGIPASPRPPRLQPQLLTRSTPPVTMHIDDEPVPASAVKLHWTVPNDGTFECDDLDLATRSLGGNTSSRLYDQLVRTDQIAQQVASGVLRLIGGQSVAYVEITGTDEVSAEHLLDRTRDCIAAFLNSGPTQAEILAARAGATAQYYTETQDLAGRADSLSHGMLLFDDAGHDSASVEGLASATAERVGASATAWLQPEAATTLTYSPTTSATAQAARSQEPQ